MRPAQLICAVLPLPGQGSTRRPDGDRGCCADRVRRARWTCRREGRPPSWSTEMACSGTAVRGCRAGHACERGDAMVVWCLLLALLLLPLGGLSVDLWHGIEVQRQLQSAAEDAATAGSSGIDVAEYRQNGCVVLDPASAVSLASANLASQQQLGPLASTDIEVAPDGDEITVVLRKNVRLTLLTLVEGNRPLVVTAEASSEPEGSVSGNGCG